MSVKWDLFQQNCTLVLVKISQRRLFVILDVLKLDFGEFEQFPRGSNSPEIRLKGL